MIGFTNIRRIHVSWEDINRVYEHLRERGRNGVEGVALWCGVAHGDEFYIKGTIIPAQTGHAVEDGLLYTVDGDELHRINVWLYKNKLTLIAQLHSHPGEAFHSATDDAYPIVATFGGISIVIPDFAFGEVSEKNWTVYRLSEQDGWVELDEHEVGELIIVS